jgi:DNA-binding CsgD family transcriptional regulator
VWWAGARGGKLYVSTQDAALTARRLEAAAQMLGLSPAQTRLTGSIVEGLSLPDAARREGVRLSTARTHLQRVFDKVGVRTQPSLVRAVMSVGERP